MLSENPPFTLRRSSRVKLYSATDDSKKPLSPSGNQKRLLGYPHPRRDVSLIGEEGDKAKKGSAYDDTALSASNYKPLVEHSDAGISPTGGQAALGAMKVSLQHGYSTRKRQLNFKYDSAYSDHESSGHSSAERHSSSRKKFESSQQSQIQNAAMDNVSRTTGREPIQTFGVKYCEKGLKRHSNGHTNTVPAFPVIGDDYESICALCGKDGGSNIRCCEFCIRVYHIPCIEASPYMAGDPWQCPRCRGIPLNYYRCDFTFADVCALYSREGRGTATPSSLKHGLGGHPRQMSAADAVKRRFEGCGKCGLPSGHQDMAVICDCCDREFHLRCLRIHELPLGDWFCTDCIDFDFCAKCVMDARKAMEGHCSSVVRGEEEGAVDRADAPVVEAEGYFGLLKKRGEPVVQCVKCLLKYHYTCVEDSCPAYIPYTDYERKQQEKVDETYALLQYAMSDSKDSSANRCVLASKESVHSSVSALRYASHDKSWLCAFCQETYGLAKILAQREHFNEERNTWESQVLCKFKELSYHHVIWLPAERAKVLHPIQWKKWEAIYDMWQNGYVEDGEYDEGFEETEERFAAVTATNGTEEYGREASSEFSAAPPHPPRFKKLVGAKHDWLKVSRVLDRRRCIRGSGKLKYLIKWQFLPYDEATWEDAFIAAGTPALSLYLQVLEIQNSIGRIPALKTQSFVTNRLAAAPTGPLLLPEGYELKEGTTSIITTGYSKRLNNSEGSIDATDSYSELKSINSFTFDNTAPQNCDTSESNISRLRHEFRRGKFVSYTDKPFVTQGGFLYDYQLEGLNWMKYSWHKRVSIILADEMGLGKTVQLISFISSLWNDYAIQGPFLIIAPLATLEDVWVREFLRWAPFINVVPYFGNPMSRELCRMYEFNYKHSLSPSQLVQWFTNSYRDIATPDFNRETVRPSMPKLCNQKLFKFDVLLTSYEIFKKDCNFFQPIKWKCIIVDEGHRLKSWNSELKRTLDNFTADQRILLTGTPLQNTIDELFSLLHFLHPEKFPENRKETLFDITEEATIEVLKRELKPHILRRIKRDILGGKIPKKKEQIILVENSKAQKDLYRRIYLKHRDALLGKTGKQIRLTSLRNIVMQLRKCCNHPYLFESFCPPCNNDQDFGEMVSGSGKLQLLHRMLTILKRNGHRLLIFSQFMKMLDILEEYLWYSGYGYERLDGSTSAVDRQRAIDRFNSQIGKKFVFLLSTKAGGFGINLTSADTVVIFDSDWNPHNDLQAQARAHRLGQKKKVAIFRFVTRASVEERIIQIARNKLVLDQVVTGQVKPTEVEYILKAGASELFSEGAEDRSIYYDDMQLEAILSRESGEAGKDVTEAEVSDQEEGQGVLDAFKVAHYETIDASELEDPDEEKNKQFWSHLLDERSAEMEPWVKSHSEGLNGLIVQGDSTKQYGRGCRRQDKEFKRLEAESLAEAERATTVQSTAGAVDVEKSPEKLFFIGEEAISKTEDMMHTNDHVDIDKDTEAADPARNLSTLLASALRTSHAQASLYTPSEEASAVKWVTEPSLLDDFLSQTAEGYSELIKQYKQNICSEHQEFAMEHPLLLKDEQTACNGLRKEALHKTQEQQGATGFSSLSLHPPAILFNDSKPPSSTDASAHPYYEYAYGVHWDMQWLCHLVELQRAHNFVQPIIVQNKDLFYLLCSVSIQSLGTDAAMEGMEHQTLSYLKPLDNEEVDVWKKEFMALSTPS